MDVVCICGCTCMESQGGCSVFSFITFCLIPLEGRSLAEPRSSYGLWGVLFCCCLFSAGPGASKHQGSRCLSPDLCWCCNCTCMHRITSGLCVLKSRIWSPCLCRKHPSVLGSRSLSHSLSLHSLVHLQSSFSSVRLKSKCIMFL